MKKQAGMAAVAVAAFIVGAATVGFLPKVYAQGPKIKAPEWHYGMSLKARQGPEGDFGPMTKKIGVEVYKDENNGNIIYVSETGSIAVLPAK
jgi:hypothetical protein